MEHLKPSRYSSPGDAAAVLRGNQLIAADEEGERRGATSALVCRAGRRGGADPGGAEDQVCRRGDRGDSNGIGIEYLFKVYALHFLDEYFYIISMFPKYGSKDDGSEPRQAPSGIDMIARRLGSMKMIFLIGFILGGP